MRTAQQLPWNLFDQLQHEVSHTRQLEKAESKAWTPAVDIKEEDNQFVLVADIPGVNPEDIDIQMENRVLTIKGERSTEEKTEHENFTRVERTQGTFYRRFTMPEGVNPDNINAKSSNGVLTLTIPKQEEVKPRKILVN